MQCPLSGYLRRFEIHAKNKHTSYSTLTSVDALCIKGSTAPKRQRCHP